MQNYQHVQKMHEFTQFDLSKQLIQSGFYTKVKLQPTTRLVLGALVSHFPNIRPSVETIANEAGCNARTVEKCLSELKKAGLILVTYTGRANHYKLTQYFFSLILPAGQSWQSEQKPPADCHPNKQMNKKNNKGFKNNFPNHSEDPLDMVSKIGQSTDRKKPYQFQSYQQKGVDYKKYVPEERKKESPLDLDELQAKEFLKNLPARMQNSFFARELKKKWNI